LSNELIAIERFVREDAATFSETPNEDSFADLFETFTHQLLRGRM
jgi:hypothetical protein